MAEKFTKTELRKAVRQLDEALWRGVYMFSWAGLLEGPVGALALNEIRLALAEKYGSKKDVANIQNALASTHYTIATARNAEGKKEEAKEHFRKALGFSDETMKLAGGFKKMSHGALMVRGSILYQLNHSEASVKCFEESLRRRGLPWDAKVICLKDLARSLATERRKEEAEKYFQQALRLVNEKKDKATVRVWKEYAIYLSKQGKKKEAEEYLARAGKMAKELGLGHQALTLEAIKIK